jgi:alanyl-tRNA synthetase
MVEVEEVSRELCGGTHVRSTAEIGLLHLTSEGSSASNVRRIEAVTGPEGIDLVRDRTEELREVAAFLRVPVDEVLPAVERLTRELRELQRRPREDGRAQADALVARAEEHAGVRLLAEVVDVPDARALLQLSDQVKQRLGAAAVVLGTAVDGRVHLVANVAPEVVGRGIRAGEVVKEAARIVGGGGGGRDTMAQAGGRDPGRLPEALTAARVQMERALS